MGKLAVVGASVLAGGGVSAGGVMLSRMFSFDSSLPISLEAFKQTEGGGCVQHLFPGLGKMDGTGATDAESASDKVEGGFFQTSQPTESCLVINWDKEEYKKENNEINWKEGKFRLLWAVQQASKGFIVFSTATTADNSEKKLSLKGVAYSTEWDDQNNKWKFSKKKEVNSGKDLDTSSIDGKFPKAHTNLTSKSFWGFMEDKDSLNKICSSSECTDDTKKSTVSFEGYWEWKGSPGGTTGGENKKLGDWTSNLTAWWKEVFGDDKWDMAKVVENMAGQWDRKVWYGIEE